MVGVQNNKNINLTRVGRKTSDFTKFSNALLYTLGDIIFEYENMQTLIYDALRYVYPVNRSLKNERESIERACKRIWDHFGIVKGTLYRLDDSELLEIKSKNKSYTQKFQEEIIGLDEVPSKYLQDLVRKVNSDLVSLMDLIRWYETHPIIASKGRPNNHEDRVLCDYYDRCVKELANIVDFQQHGIKKKALSKANHHTMSIMKTFASISDTISDRPYRFSQPFSIHYFDVRRMNLIGHRIGEFPMGMAPELEELYKNDKAKFYRIYFKRIPVEQHFQNFRFYFPYLPLKNDRRDIFESLIKSFRARRWIDFYSVAILQVEGLFSEMCSIVYAAKAESTPKSLPDKVNSIRPFHDLSDAYFDYYQYHIPIQRNRIGHTGYDEDLKLKSYDLLVDLSHLLTIFYELDNPLVKINKIHKQRDSDRFSSLKDLVAYFRLIDRLAPSQKNNIKENLSNFESEFLVPQCNSEWICYQVSENAGNILGELSAEIELILEKEKVDESFEALAIPRIERLIENTVLQDSIRYRFLMKEDDIKDLMDFGFILKMHRKYLPSMSQEIHQKLDRDKELLYTSIHKISKITGYTI